VVKILMLVSWIIKTYGVVKYLHTAYVFRAEVNLLGNGSFVLS
jgi:hypothetical protein